jgi:hypothetical protein
VGTCEFVVDACKCTFACDETPTYELHLEIVYKFVINACKFVVVAYECTHNNTKTSWQNFFPTNFFHNTTLCHNKHFFTIE